MKPFHVIAVVVLLLGLASAGFCQWNYTGLTSDSVTARWMGMGGTGTAAANDEGAIDFNPALLATLDLGMPMNSNSPLASKGSLTGSTGEYDAFSVKVATVNVEQGWGAGVGYEHATKWWIDDILQVGVGYKIPNTQLSVGAQVANWEGDYQGFLGAVYDFPQKELSPIRLGAVWGNFTSADGVPSWLNLGLVVPVTPELRLAVDMWDATDNMWKTFWSFGAEYQLQDGIAVRAGALDGDFSAGAGYKRDAWSLDAAFSSFWGDNQVTVTGGCTF